MNVTIPWLHTVIVRPTLEFMAKAADREWIASPSAQALMLGIAVTESDLRHTRQVALGGKDGPARSFWQVEPATALDVLSRRRTGTMRSAIEPFLPPDGPPGTDRFQEAMRYSQSLGCMLARLKIMDAAPAVPDWIDIAGQANYWKLYYNTHLGAGHPDDYGHAMARHNVLSYAESVFGGVEV